MKMPAGFCRKSDVQEKHGLFCADGAQTQHTVREADKTPYASVREHQAAPKIAAARAGHSNACTQRIFTRVYWDSGG